MPVATRKQEVNRKRIALSFFRLIAAQEGPIAALRIFHPKAKHHNPYCEPGIKRLFEEMKKVQQSPQANDMPFDPVFRIKNAIVDGDMVMVFTTMQSRSNKKSGFRQVHMFRFNGDKVAEYWDVTQMVPKEAKYPLNMF